MKKIFIMCIIVAIANLINNVWGEENFKEQFEQKYKTWKNYISQFKIMISSTTSSRTECNEFKEIVNLGPKAVPFIVDKMKSGSEDSWLLSVALQNITKVKFDTYWDEKNRKVIYVDLPNLKQGESPYVYWYHYGRFQTPKQFEKLYSDWKDLKKQGRQKEADEKFQRMKGLGIVAIPNFIEKIKKGDSDLISALEYLSNGEVNSNAKPQECVKWWERNKEKWTLPQ